MTPRLRPVTMGDAQVLFDWRNDPTTRAMSFSQEPVEWADHLRWLGASLANQSRWLHVLEADAVPAGVVRFDLDDGVYEGSWTIAPEFRGRGLAARMIAMALRTPCIAQVKPENAACIRTVRSLGFELVEDGECLTFRLERMRRAMIRVGRISNG